MPTIVEQCIVCKREILVIRTNMYMYDNQYKVTCSTKCYNSLLLNKE
jgi:hypothetical protein